MKKAYTSVDQVEGFNDLNEADQDKVRAAWESEEVASEDIPPTAVGTSGSLEIFFPVYLPTL
jgi:hypothetical protein